MTSAGIYARISRDDDHTELGVTRQIDDCQREAARRGWSVVQIYSDNDVSASGRKPRPAFDRMLVDAKAQRISALVCWDADRLSRSPKENEQIIDLADATGLQLANVGGEVDLSSPQGRMTFRIKGAVAKHEIEQSSRRIRRKFDERAASGLPHGMVAYGYRRVIDYDGGRRTGTHDEINHDQARVIREVAASLLAGESLRSLARRISDRGDLSPRGIPWTSTSLRQVMLRDRNAGLRRHRGEVVGKAAWEPILPEEIHLAVVALLTDPGRRQSRGSTRQHLLSAGLAVCGRCGEANFRVLAPSAHAGKTKPASYQCSSCYRVARKQSAVDEYVEAVVIARLSKPDAIAALASGQPARAQELRGQVGGLEARLAIAADEFADGAITGEQLRRITANIRGQIHAAKSELAHCSPSPGLLDLAGVYAATRWAQAPLEVRRAVIDTLMVVTINGVGSGHGRTTPVEESVVIQWKGEK